MLTKYALQGPLEVFHEEEPMKANVIKANAIPPQPDETFFPSARIKSVPAAILSNDQTEEAMDHQRCGDRLRRNRPKE